VPPAEPCSKCSRNLCHCAPPPGGLGAQVTRPNCFVFVKIFSVTLKMIFSSRTFLQECTERQKLCLLQECTERQKLWNCAPSEVCRATETVELRLLQECTERQKLWNSASFRSVQSDRNCGTAPPSGVYRATETVELRHLQEYAERQKMSNCVPSHKL
jgi:hypothetical protein